MHVLWRKVWRDVWTRKARTFQVVLSIGVGVFILQIRIHRQHHQQTVLGGPGPWRLAQQQVLERPDCQRAQTDIDTMGIGFEHAPVVGRQVCENLLRNVAQPVQAQRAIVIQRAAPEQFRQFTGGRAALQIHLEKTLLCVQEPDGASQVIQAPGVKHGYAETIAFYRNRRLQAGKIEGTFELRKTTMQRRPTGEKCSCRQQDSQ